MASATKRYLKYSLWSMMTLFFFLVCLAKKIFGPFLRYFLAKDQVKVIRTADERFNGLDSLGYTFQANYARLPIGGGQTLPRVHYVDEGRRDGRVVLCLHGEPTWSFLYRKMIHIFVKAGYRVIVPDFIGFGKSDKYTSPDNYTHELHCMTLRLLIDELKLKDVTLVVQDWGGLTGLNVLKDMPDRFANLAIMNTALPLGTGFRRKGAKISNMLAFISWQLMVEALGIYLPLEFFFRKMGKMPESSIVAYVAPFPDARYVGGAAAWPLLAPILCDGTIVPEMKETRQFLSTWKKPVLVMFSSRDPVMRGMDRDFVKLMPHAKQVTIKGAGHFLQETHGEECAENIVKFLSDL